MNIGKEIIRRLKKFLEPEEGKFGWSSNAIHNVHRSFSTLKDWNEKQKEKVEEAKKEINNE